MGTSYSFDNEYRWFWHKLTADSESWVPFPLDRCLNFEKAYQRSLTEFQGKGFVLYFDRNSDEQTHILVNEDDNLSQTCVSRRIPGEVHNISRSQKMNNTSFTRFEDLKVSLFHYWDIFEPFEIDQDDPFIKEFTFHVTLLDNRLINFLLTDYKSYLQQLVNKLGIETFNFEAMCLIMKYGFLHSSAKDMLKAYVSYYLDYLSKKNFIETIIGMFAEEGELYHILNNALRTSQFEGIHECVLFLLCLIFIYENYRELACKGNQVVYTMINYSEQDYEILMKSICSQSLLFTNFEFMSTSQSIVTAMKCLETQHQLSKHVLLEITIDKNEYEEYYFLALKPFSLSPIQQYQEIEIVFPPNGVFKVKESSDCPQEGMTVIKVDYQTNFVAHEVQDYSEQDKLMWGICSKLSNSSRYTIPLNKYIYARLDQNSIGHWHEMQNLNALSIKGSNLGGDGISKTFAKITDLPRLKYLDIGGNLIGDEGLKVISDKLWLFQLEYLKLSNNLIKADGISYFAEKIEELNSLILLDLSENLIGDEGLSMLAPKLHFLGNLEVLDISKNLIMNQGFIALADVLPSLPQLVSLSLKENPICNDAMIAISSNLHYLTSIRTLNLSHIEDISISMIDIKPANSIQFLFSNTQKLKLPYLQTLNLSSNQIKEKMMTSFALKMACGDISFPMLQILNLNWNKIRENGMIELTNQLIHVPNVQYLYIRGNNILDGGAMALAKNIFLLPNLQALDISRNQIGDAGIVELTRAFDRIPKLRELNIGQNLFTSIGMIAVAENLPSLPNLQLLSLSGNKGSLENIPKLFLSDKLQCLNLNYTSISPKGMEVFASNLTYLPCLRSLYLHGNIIGVSGMKALVKKLAQLPNLQLLDLTGNQVTNDGISAFTQHILSQYQPCTIRDLFLSSNKIDDVGLKVFSLCLPFLSSLRSLDLSSNLISDDGIFALVSHFPQMRSIENLNLCSNSFGNKGMIELSGKVSQLSHLQSLELKYNHVGDEGLIRFSATLCENKALKSIDIRGNEITESGIDGFFKNLGDMEVMKSIDLKINASNNN